MLYHTKFYQVFVLEGITVGRENSVDNDNLDSIFLDNLGIYQILENKIFHLTFSITHVMLLPTKVNLETIYFIFHTALKLLNNLQKDN